MRELVVSLAICALMAALEGAMAGSGVKQRFAELRLPAGSPTLPFWIAIGVFYYVVSFIVLYRLLLHGLTGSLTQIPFALMLVIMTYNAGWNWLFFRRRDLKASFLSFIPYGVLIAALIASLLRVDLWAVAALSPYLGYLLYATWWGYRLWRLNSLEGGLQQS
jgi:tryptophan-rich sensory protein